MFIRRCREFSIPLIVGVILAVVWANLAPESYHHIVHTPIIGEHINLHWLVNDVFMVFFFAIAGVAPLEDKLRAAEKAGGRRA